jgi:hypothetical protein
MPNLSQARICPAKGHDLIPGVVVRQQSGGDDSNHWCDNASMTVLRNSKLIASLVLAWFALFLASAVASPVIKPASMQVLCMAGGVLKIVDVDGNGGEVQASLGMDCPLCAAAVALPVHPSPPSLKPCSLEHALHPMATAHIAALAAPPLPSRGPPIST